MIIRGLLIAGIAVVVVFPAGCVNQTRDNSSREAAVRSVSPPPLVPAETATTPNEVNATADELNATSRAEPDVLARRAEQYSQEIEQLLARRGSATIASPAVPVERGSPSQVRWVDPSEFRLGDLPLATQLVPSEEASYGDTTASVQPILESSPPQANRIDSRLMQAESVQAAPQQRHDTSPPTVPDSDANVEVDLSAPASLDSLGERLASRVRNNPRDISAHLEYQLLQLLLDERVPQLSTLGSLPAEDRELISTVLDGMSLFRSTLRSDNNMLLSRRIRPLLEMTDRLRTQADLSIPTVALCRSVEGFGRYEPLEPARFVAGVAHKPVLYCEIANFASNLNDSRMWETRLKQDLVLYTEQGVPVWNSGTSTVVDQSRRRRQDFFVNQRVTIPSNLTMGRYLLKVSIVDEHAHRVAEASVPVVIAAE